MDGEGGGSPGDDGCCVLKERQRGEPMDDGRGALEAGSPGQRINGVGVSVLNSFELVKMMGDGCEVWQIGGLGLDDGA